MKAERSVRPRRRTSRRPPKRKRAEAAIQKGDPGAPRQVRRWLWTVLSVLAFGVVLPFAAVLWWATRPGPGSGQVEFEVQAGEPTSRLAERLTSSGLVDSPRLFRVYADVLAPSVATLPGPHLLPKGVSPRRLLQCLARLPSRPTARVTVPEGYTHVQIGERLERRGICTAARFRAVARDTRVLERVGISGDSAEGYLFPATYELFLDADPEQVLSLLVAETRKRLTRLNAASAGALDRLAAIRGWSERDVLTLASIVERESAAPDERARIASVFFNRLDDATFRPARRLQSDPTAGYGCLVLGDRIPSCVGYRGRVTPEMVRDAANPYNTYRHAGLPPGPIANPGEGAVSAVLQPDDTDYLYFVLGPDGRHRFGRSFDEHRRAIEE